MEPQAQPQQVSKQKPQPEAIGQDDPLAQVLGGQDSGGSALADLWAEQQSAQEPQDRPFQAEAVANEQQQPRAEEEQQAEKEQQPQAEKQQGEQQKQQEELLPKPLLKVVDELWPGEIIETPEQLRAKLEHLRDLETAAGLLESELPDEMWAAIEQYVQEVQALEQKLGRELGDIERKRLWWGVMQESGVLEARPPDPNEDPEGYARWIEAEALRRVEAQKAQEEQKRMQELEARREQRLEALAREFRERHQLPEEEYESFITQVQRLMVGDPETGELPRRPNIFEVLYLGLKALGSQETARQAPQRSVHGSNQRPARRPPDLTGQTGGPRPQQQPAGELDYLLQIAEREAQDPWGKIL
jgi:hypothetical protein